MYTTDGAALSTTSAMKLKRLLGGMDDLSKAELVAAETVLRGD